MQSLNSTGWTKPSRHKLQAVIYSYEKRSIQSVKHLPAGETGGASSSGRGAQAGEQAAMACGRGNRRGGGCRRGRGGGRGTQVFVSSAKRATVGWKRKRKRKFHLRCSRMNEAVMGHPILSFFTILNYKRSQVIWKYVSCWIIIAHWSTAFFLFSRS